MAGSSALLTKLDSSSICLALSAGSETLHSIGVSFARRGFDASSGWRATPDREPEPEQSEDESGRSDASDEKGLGMRPRPVGSFPSPISKMRGEDGPKFANGLGRGSADAGAGVYVRAPWGVFQVY